MADASLLALQQWAARRFKTQPKKTAALSILVVVMAVMWGKVLFTGKTGPASAMAKMSASKANPDRGVGASSAMPQAMLALQRFTRSSPDVMHRNLFLVKLEHFAKDGSTLSKDAAVSEGFWDELAKSFAAKADQEKAKQILVENLRSRAARLDLQSTMMKNGAPKAMVNGILVGEGDTIDGFRVEKIEARRIVVEREGVKLEIVFKF